jgi:hypothetical protein
MIARVTTGSAFEHPHSGTAGPLMGGLSAGLLSSVHDELHLAAV